MGLRERIGKPINILREVRAQKAQINSARARYEELCQEAKPSPDVQSWTVFDARVGLTSICRTPEEKMRAYNPSPERIADLLTPVKNLQR